MGSICKNRGDNTIMARTRGVLIDTTIGKLFNGVANTSAANAYTLIAGSQSKLTQFVRAGNAAVALNINGGILFTSTTLITSYEATVDFSPTVQGIVMKLRTGSTYATSSIVATINLPTTKIYVPAGRSAPTGARSIATVSINVTAGNRIFWDITQIGIGVPGTNLTVKLTYYTGY